MRRVVRVLLSAASFGAVAWAAGHAYIAAHRTWPPPSAADAVLVLGTSSTVRGEPNPCMRTRVGEGVRLVQEGLAPVLIVSGGLDARDGLVEADSMADLAVELGIDRDRVLREDRSTSTIENLSFSYALLEDIDQPSMIVVTEPFHLPRAVMAADRLGLDVEPAPSPACLGRDHTWIFREPVALWWYWLRFPVGRPSPATSATDATSLARCR
jgi:uncharacterized SAM-binding protein YcdF (DUF218 family)